MPPDETSVKPKSERPRDELGRPLPRGARNRLVMEDYESLDLAENHRLAREHFNAGRFFPAHEAWESAWRQARGTADEEFFKGLSQIGAGYTHYRRGNARGARALLRRGLGRIARYGPRHHAINIEPLVRALESDADAFGEAERARRDLPKVTPPRI